MYIGAHSEWALYRMDVVTWLLDIGIQVEIIAEMRYGMDEMAIVGMRSCDADDRWDAMLGCR